jgi:hypothetical protein
MKETLGNGLKLNRREMSRLYLVAFVTVAVVVFGELACTSVPLTSPTGSTISISSDRDVLPLNGQATLRAVVIESSGTPVQNGTVVNFTTTLGNVDPPEAKTINGVATSTFNAGSISGTTTVHAFSGGTKTGSGNSSGGGVSIKIGSAAAASVSVSATPSSVSQSGGTVTISALVMDPSNNPLPGVQVVFSSTTGTLSSSTALSDSTGVARIQFTTSQTAKVTATVNGTAKADVDVVVSTAPTVTIEAPSPASPVVGQPVTFNVSTTSGNTTAPRQVQTLEVNFGDGTSEVRSNVTGSTAFTHTYNREGGYTITARAVDVSGNTGLASRAIIVGFAPSPTVTVSSSPTSGTTATVFTVTVNAQPSSSSGAPIRSVVVRTNDGTVLYSSSSGGSQQFPVQFSSPGARTLIATTTDAAGQSATSSIVVNVS